MIKEIIRSIFIKMKHPSIEMHGISSVDPVAEIKMHDGGQIVLGKRVSTNKRVTLSAIGGKLIIEDDVFLNRNVIIVCREKVLIGSHSAIGPNVVIYDHDHQYCKDGYEGNMYKCDPIIIEKNVWIGANAAILRGSHIGEGSIIGAGSIVKGTIPSYSLVTLDRTLNIVPIDGHINRKLQGQSMRTDYND